MNTFRMKVSCDTYVEYCSVEDLRSLDFSSLPGPWLHIGAGSNLLFTGDFPGTVFHSAIRTAAYEDIGGEDVRLTAGAGLLLDDLVKDSCAKGLWGLENLSLIPGEAGAAAVQNVGAYGTEIKDVVEDVTCFDLKTMETVVFNVSDCAYAYRDSLFKHSGRRYIVTLVSFHLTRRYSPNLSYRGLAELFSGRGGLTPEEIRGGVAEIRRAKLPDPAEIGSAGSFFKNPVMSAERFARLQEAYHNVPHYVLEDGSVKVPAAWMIEQCGYKGFSTGNVAVYEKQPLVLVNASGKASPQEVIDLENRIITSIREKFEVELHPEVEHI